MDILIIGLGSMGKRRTRLLKKFDVVGEIIGVDAREDRREEAVKVLGCKTYNNVERALKENTRIECAFICTSPLSHSGLIHTALKHGLHVFTEINLVSEGYEENMHLAEKTGRVLFLSSTFYYREEIQYIQNVVKDRFRLNYIYHIGQYLPDWHPWENYKDFFVGEVRTSGCREIMAIELPWLTGTFGKIRNFHVVSDKMSDLEIPYHDNYIIVLEHETGSKGMLAVDVVSPNAVRRLEIYGENIYLAWNGSPASLEEYDPLNKSMKKIVLYETVEQREGYRDFVVENAYQNEIAEFLDVVMGDRVSRYGFAQDLEVLRLIDRIEGAQHG